MALTTAGRLAIQIYAADVVSDPRVEALADAFDAKYTSSTFGVDVDEARAHWVGHYCVTFPLKRKGDADPIVAVPTGGTARAQRFYDRTDHGKAFLSLLEDVSGGPFLLC